MRAMYSTIESNGVLKVGTSHCITMFVIGSGDLEVSLHTTTYRRIDGKRQRYLMLVVALKNSDVTATECELEAGMSFLLNVRRNRIPYRPMHIVSRVVEGEPEAEDSGDTDVIEGYKYNDAGELIRDEQ